LDNIDRRETSESERANNLGCQSVCSSPRKNMSSDSKKSAASRKASAKVLWRSHSAGDLAGAKKKTLVVNDKTWVYRHTHETAGLVTITVKAGNRDYALDSYTEDQKTRISENLLRRRYR
jgi:hypothetical protein